MFRQFSKSVLKKVSIDKLINLQGQLLYFSRAIEAVVDEKRIQSYSSTMKSKWKVTGSPSDHQFKASLIKEIKNQYNFKVFVETGSFKGDMIRKQLNSFKRIFSIEFLPAFYFPLKEEFKEKKHVELIQGNSGDVLPSLLQQIEEPCIFWLDAHLQVGKPNGSKIDAPVKDEIDAILSHPFKNIVLIDDARYFNGSLNYPTIDEVERKFKQKDSTYNVSIQGDVIIIK